MKTLAEIEVARMKVAAEDTCKSQLADSREQARTLTAEASAHANQVMADANQQSQNIVAEAVQKANEMIANAQKQSQDMVNEATKLSRSMIHEATERSQKMVFVAEAKAAAAIDTYNTMVNKANSQSKQLRSLLQSQLSLYDNFDAEFAVEQMVQPKLNAVKTAEPVLDTKAEPVAATVAPKETEPSPGELAEVIPKQGTEKADEITAQDEVVKTAAEEMPAGENAVKAAEEEKQEEEKAVENTNQAGDDKSSADESNEYAGTRKPLFSRFNPRGSMVFNRNGFPRKNADLRVALSELQKTAQPRPQGGEAKPEPQNEGPKPEENKES
jgi:hypothetical protein